MSGTGAPELGRRLDDLEIGAHVAVVAARWHEEIMDGLLAGALRALGQAGARVEVFRVAGSVELPLVVLQALRKDRFDAAVALGVVIRGGTPHFEYVCQAAASGLAQAALETGKPVGFGLLTCDDELQARDRAGLDGSREDKGAEAAAAALETLVVLESVEHPGRPGA
jgi:6,7-dimethyl-8-ribityllumazine synthase